MRYRVESRFTATILLALLSLCWASALRAQDEPIPFDTSVVEIIERIPVPRNVQARASSRCEYEPRTRQSSWILMRHQAGDAVLCYPETGEIRQLPIERNWIAYETGEYRQLSVSPDNNWIILTAYGSEQYDYYAYSLDPEAVIFLGEIPYSPLASYPPDVPTWLSSTQAAVIYWTNSDSLWDTLYTFDLSQPNSMREVLRGYPYAIDDPPARVETLYNGRWLSQMAGTFMGSMPCEFAIYDAEGLRVYPLGHDCQVEARSPDPNTLCSVIRSDGTTLVVLRVIDFDSGLSELISLRVTTPDAQPTILYRGEIDYMLEHAGGTTLSVLGTDGKIPYTLYQECLFADITPFAGSDMLLATERGTHVIPAGEIPDNLGIEILATSPDESRVLLSNGAIYDVVKHIRVANITGGVSIDYTTVTWNEDERLVFVENYDPETDEQITIRLKV